MKNQDKEEYEEKIKELEESFDNLKFKQKQDLDYICRFIYLINHNAFDRQFLIELFAPSELIDMRIASKEIIHFIISNKYRWAKLK